MADELPTHPATPNLSIQWDDSDMESLYANVATATANREEFFLLFGTHQNWRGAQPKNGEANNEIVRFRTIGDVTCTGAVRSKAQPKNGEVSVALSKRIVMSPFAAKRMAAILNQSLEVYEKQFGKIDI